MNKIDKYLGELFDKLAISGDQETQEVKIQDFILSVEDIRSKWRSILASVFDSAAVEMLVKHTKPTHIEKNTLYIAVQQADEQFLLTLNEKKIIDYLSAKASTFLYPTIISKIENLKTRLYA